MVKTTKKGARITMMLPERSHIKLSRMLLKVQAQGLRCFKQDLNAALIDYFDAHPEKLKEIQLSYEK